MDNLSRPTRIAIGSILTFVSGFFLYLKANSDDIPRDLVAVYTLIKLKRTMAALAKTQGYSLADVWERTAAAYPNKTALTFIQDDNSQVNFTYKEVDAKVNQGLFSQTFLSFSFNLISCQFNAQKRSQEG